MIHALFTQVCVCVCVEAARLAAVAAGTYSVIVSCGTRRGAQSMPLPPDTATPALNRDQHLTPLKTEIDFLPTNH